MEIKCLLGRLETYEQNLFHCRSVEKEITDMRLLLGIALVDQEDSNAAVVTFKTASVAKEIHKNSATKVASLLSLYRLLDALAAFKQVGAPFKAIPQVKGEVFKQKFEVCRLLFICL